MKYSKVEMAFLLLNQKLKIIGHDSELESSNSLTNFSLKILNIKNTSINIITNFF